MKKNIPMTKMNIFAFVFVVLLTAGIIALVMNFSLTIKDEPVEEVVIDKNIKKGLYLYPRFEAITKKYEKPIKISKERYETLEIGDKINGYQKSSNEMIVEEGIRFELSIGILAIIFFLAVTIFFGSSLFSNTLFFRSRPSLKEWMQKSGVICIYVFTVMYIAVGFMFTFLTAKNLFHKYNTSQLVETEAIVLGGDWNQTRANRGASYTVFELFLYYTDETGEEHVTKKAVTRNTYELYDVEENIPITYRKNNVYDTFILTKSFNETWSAIINLYTIFLTLYIISVLAIIRRLFKKRKERQNNNKENFPEIRNESL